MSHVERDRKIKITSEKAEGKDGKKEKIIGVKITQKEEREIM